MDDRQYEELFGAILDLREATDLGFAQVYRRFDEERDRSDRRFNALETRMEAGFRDVSSSLQEIGSRLSVVEQR
jgi:hypothetical protein